MNEIIINEISNELNVKSIQVSNTLKLLEEGNTIPFIARYRKEVTNNLNEEEIRKISDVYNYQVNLLKRKEDVIRLIDEKGLLTDEIKENILKCTKLIEVEDIYRPYKEKKKTKATEAIKNGLEPLAKMIMSFPVKGSLDMMADKFITENVKTREAALEGASFIIAEYISDNAYYRKWIRNYLYKKGIITCKKKKDSIDDNKTYEMYYDYKEAIKEIKDHRILAINRAENEKVITVNIDINNDEVLSFLEEKIIKNKDSFVCNLVIDAIKDSFKRLIFPSVEREVRSELKEKAELTAIENFSKNLESLLMQKPIKDKMVLAFDPGYTNGCKLAVIDKTGKYLESTVIKPFASSEKSLIDAKNTLLLLIKKYKVDIIAIGNGTASRESEKLCADLIKDNNLDTKYVIVSEAGASIYSTEKVAIDEFPNLSPNERSAVSIGRRIQDPLSELVKIPPEGIGVGLYQHDVKESNLKESLDFVVLKAVNSVGVNINTASSSLLKYVSGLTKTYIDKILKYRDTVGKIKGRSEVKKILSDKAYEQSIGFMRIIDADDYFDRTSIHPESYELAEKILNKYNIKKEEIGNIGTKLDNVNIEDLSKELNSNIYTVEDIIEALKKPNRDPRDEMDSPLLKSDVLELKDLKVGMELEGTVRNVVDFGAFVDIGLHEDGLIHISKMSKDYIKHPSDILSVGDIITCYVYEINMDKKKVSLSLIKE